MIELSRTQYFLRLTSVTLARPKRFVFRDNCIMTLNVNQSLTMNRWIDGLPFCSRSPPADPDPPTSLNRCSADTRIHRPETAQISRSFYLFMSFKHLIDGVKCHAWGIYVIWCGKQYQDLWWSIKFQKGFSQFLKWFILLFEKTSRTYHEPPPVFGSFWQRLHDLQGIHELMWAVLVQQFVPLCMVTVTATLLKTKATDKVSQM